MPIARGVGRVIAPAPAEGTIWGFALDPADASAYTFDSGGSLVTTRTESIVFTDLDAGYPSVSNPSSEDENHLRFTVIDKDPGGFVGEGALVGLYERSGGSGEVLTVWDVANAAVYWIEKEEANDECIGPAVYKAGKLYWPQFDWVDGSPPTVDVGLWRANPDLTGTTEIGTWSVDAAWWGGSETTATINGEQTKMLVGNKAVIMTVVNNDVLAFNAYWRFELSGTQDSRTDVSDDEIWDDHSRLGLPSTAVSDPVGRNFGFGTDTLDRMPETGGPVANVQQWPTSGSWISSIWSHASVNRNGTSAALYSVDDGRYISDAISGPHGADPIVDVSFPVSPSIIFAAIKG